MSRPEPSELLSALTRPSSVIEFNDADWERLIRHGRAADVLGQVAARLRDAQVWEQVPVAAQMHLASAERLAQRQHVELRYEVAELGRVLAAAGVRAVVLKGAAYALQGLTVAAGRLVSDVDVLVDAGQLAQAESALMLAGWVTMNPDPYDQAYYRRWMHELPPMRHVGRGSVLDLHHAILPITASLNPSTSVLMQDVRPMDACPDLMVLSPADMLLHSAVHLMHEGELEMGFRGLLDIDALVKQFARDATFWARLTERAHLLGLQWPLLLALRYAREVLDTQVPDAVLGGLLFSCGRQARGWRLIWLDALYRRALIPHHAELEDGWSAPARFFLYLRSHLLRMPLRLLVPHLLRKSTRRMVMSTSQEKTA